jgi:hypothetical protein
MTQAVAEKRPLADNMERVLADIDSDGLGRLRHRVLLVVGASRPKTLAGQEHGRTIPLADIRPQTTGANDRGLQRQSDFA